MNTNFADIVSNALVFAPEMLTINGRTIAAPTADDYASAGYWPVTETHPDPATGKHEVEGTPEKIGTEHTREEERIVPLTPEEEAENARRMAEWEAAGAQGDPPELIEPHTETVVIHYTTYEIHRIWTLVDDVKVPRTFSKLKAVAALMQAGYWERCKQYITDAGLYDLYLAAQDFREDNAYFVQGLAQIKSELGLTDEAVEAILAQCVAED